MPLTTPTGQLKLRLPKRFGPIARGRFFKNRRELLVSDLGRQPTTAEAILIERVVSIEWSLRQIDRRITSDLSIERLRSLLRMAAPLESQLRLHLASLGMQPPAPVDMLQMDLMTQIRAEAQEHLAEAARRVPEAVDPTPPPSVAPS